MADNYLEKRMADYRAGRLRPGARRLPLPPAGYALIYAFSISDLKQLALALRSRGWSVAFCCADSREGSLFAQSSGCRFYPFDPADADVRRRVESDLFARWGRVDAVADCCNMPDCDLNTPALLEKVLASAGGHENNQ